MKGSLFAAIVFGTALPLLSVAPVQAEFPEKPISMIVPFAAGGSTDVGARMIVPFMEKYMPKGASFVVVNKGGAGGEIGATAVASSTPDGYMIGWMNVPNIMMKPHEHKTHYDVNSFAPICNVVYDLATLATLPDSKFQTLADVVAEAKKRPGEITVSSAGVGSNTHLDVINFENAAGIKLNHVPFDGGAPARNALMGGHTELYAATLGDTGRFAEAGKMRILGIMATERSALAPNVPTYKEQGYDITGGSARGLVGPKDMPKEAVAMIAEAVKKAIEDPELIQKAKETGIPLSYMGSAEYAQYMQDSDKVIAEIWKNTPWK